VRSAEERVASAWAAFAAGRGEAPDKKLLEEVASLRRECDKRLAAILDSYPGPGKPSVRARSDPPADAPGTSVNR
jgi:hypothetical protein